MPPDLPPEALKSLRDLGSGYRLIHSRAAGDSGACTIIAKIVDTMTNTVWAEATGDTEQTAVLNAIDAAQNGERPKSPAATATENVTLKGRVAELEAQLQQANATTKSGVSKTANVMKK